MKKDSPEQEKYQASYIKEVTREDELTLTEYNPEEDYRYKSVTETDPWYTTDHITIHHTSGGDFFVKRKDGTEPNNLAETYVGPFFRWAREPEYDKAKRRSKFGILGEPVIGIGYYGKHGRGKPKNQGLRFNLVLAPLTSTLRKSLGGPSFFTSTDPDPSAAPEVTNWQEIKLAKDKGVHLDQVAENNKNLQGGITVKNTGNKKFIHTTDLVSLRDAISVLSQGDTNMSALASAAGKYGMKGRAPIITNQPNTKIDFDNKPLNG